MPRVHLSKVLSVLSVLILLAGTSVLSQTQAPKNAPPEPASNAPDSNGEVHQPVILSKPNQQNDQAPESDQSVETLRVNVGVVQLFFNVKDKRGALIPNLAKTDFQIFEDGKPQTIKYFAAESNLPLTLGILI